MLGINNNCDMSNNNDGNGFTYLFNGQNIDGWRMAGPGKFVLLNMINQ